MNKAKLVRLHFVDAIRAKYSEQSSFAYLQLFHYYYYIGMTQLDID